MSLSKTSLLPRNYDFPVNVQMRIELIGGEYKIILKKDASDWHEFFINLTRDDIKNLNAKLQIALDTFALQFEININGSKERAKSNMDLISKIAEKGNYAFKKIFSEGSLRETMREVLKDCQVIQITSQDFFIPWELLYDGHLDNRTDATLFWGMRFIISRNLIRSGNEDGFASPVLPSPPNVGFVQNGDLNYVSETEIPALQTFEQQNQLQLSVLEKLNPQQPRKALGRFRQFLGDNIQILHLACHVDEEQMQGNSYQEPYLVISDKFRINMEDLYIRDFTITRNKPFVILNGCRTGTINPLSTSNWAVLFSQKGARGVLATEFHVPDWFAADFIVEVYKQLLAGESIGEALLATRRLLYHKDKNPMGLAYALYSRLDIRISVLAGVPDRSRPPVMSKVIAD